jgi:hypothetical protein
MGLLTEYRQAWSTALDHYGPSATSTTTGTTNSRLPSKPGKESMSIPTVARQEATFSKQSWVEAIVPGI